MRQLAGFHAALPTPFSEDGSRIAEDVIGQLVERNFGSGLDGLYVGGSTGECYLLSDEERLRLFALVAEAAMALAPGGVFAIYGPFLRERRATSDGDARFHESLVAQDPVLGYKDVADVEGWIGAQGLHLTETRAMPANNLFIVAHRPD
jgi:hypothetical protein